MANFKVGDRVVLARPDKVDALNKLPGGSVGTISRMGPPPALLLLDPEFPVDSALVRFDNYDDGIDAIDGDGTNSYRNINLDQLDPAA